MDITVEPVNVWAASVRDEAGASSQLLAGLRDAGVDLDFVLASIAKRTPGKPGMGVMFVTPLCRDSEIAAASRLGFKVTSSVHSVRVEGDNRPYIAAELTEKLAAVGISLRGFSAAVVGPRFTFYVGLDSAADAKKAADILQAVYK